MTSIDDEQMVDTVSTILNWHLPDKAHESGCALRCGYHGEDLPDHLARTVLTALATQQTATSATQAVDAEQQLQHVCDLMDHLANAWTHLRLDTADDQQRHHQLLSTTRRAITATRHTLTATDDKANNEPEDGADHHA